jgi:hypothetical protein
MNGLRDRIATVAAIKLRGLRRWLDELDPPPVVKPQDGGPRPTVPR